MLRALYSAAAGMESQQMNLDVISNNLANVNTTGYKESKLQFRICSTRRPGRPVYWRRVAAIGAGEPADRAGGHTHRHGAHFHER